MIHLTHRQIRDRIIIKMDLTFSTIMHVPTYIHKVSFKQFQCFGSVHERTCVAHKITTAVAKKRVH